ncbi:SigB/SigF/SigG family RNA polymerase sigma factor [Pseudosporangium ferrugineum]|uniref:RNA polymerase sigma-28 (SigD/FliA/WhiG) subunit n=1 Tax=Pseudosporangium ferrugineum TaxID=439699 RepID=A0A2T0SFX1_9ACTN|nr:SigB/SigF/SigG family RNA polymerase sigma factor [Pseudosporangium ferrugineum]PRY32297.1 RNA polymerase sigma-28 (SigD/FliA/WhiG) subunit [Pseudosporangium ferrugineum]
MTITTTRVTRTGLEALREMAAAPPGPRRARLRDEAIRAWLPLAQHLARRYSGRGEPDDDLLQTATVGLIKAIDRFDPERGVEFAGFAIPTVLGEIRRHFRDRTWSVRVPRRLQELRLSITEAGNALTQSLGRSPTVADIAAHLSVTEEEVLEGLEGARAYSATSLSTPVTEDGATSLGDLLGADDHDLELAELRIALGPAMATLDERERTILSLRFFGNLTQSEIAGRIGVSQMHISRLITRALGKLRAQLTAG